MSQENVEIVRATFEAWNAGDMSALRESCDPAIVVRFAEGWRVGSEPAMGRDAYMRWCEQLRETWDAQNIEPLSFSDGGDRVVVRLIWHGAGHGPDLNLEVSSVNTLREGKVILLEYFWDHAEALETVGLLE